MTLLQRLQDVKARIQRACEAAQRDPSEVTLLAVSKTKPTAQIRAAWDAGQTQFGENYVQEWRQKFDELQDLHQAGLQWHFIGHLQRNKCKTLAGTNTLIHTVDSFELLKELEKRTPEGHTQDVLLQLNLAKEETKSGFQSISALLPALTPETPWRRIQIRGLMTIPPFLSPEEVRPYFRQTRECQEELTQTLGIELPELSMGMSQDLEVAIQEGSTIVRVGTAIFGPRERP